VNDDAVSLSAIGMACPVGFGWLVACAALRAGLSRKTISPYRDNQAREIVASYLPGEGLNPDVSCEERWLFFLAHALSQLFEPTQTGGGDGLGATTMHLALPPAADERPHDAEDLAEGLSSRLGVVIRAEQLRITTGGSAASVLALQEARTAARAGQTVVVAAADSLISARRLLPLSTRNRLLVEGNSDGVIPGEAAVAFRLSRDKRDALGVLRGLGRGQEPSSLHNDVALRAEGLTDATRAALAEARVPLHEIDFRLSDAAGESFFFKEQALLLTRVMRERREALPLWLPAGPLGDTGAAASFCGLAWACAAWRRGYAPGPRAIVLASGEGSARGAVIVERAS
jgi:3-oxoacyl-[acyl-carrier-protein] synthase I